MAMDLSDLVAAFDVGTVGTAILAIGAAMAVPHVVGFGVRMIHSMIEPDDDAGEYDADGNSYGESFQMMQEDGEYGLRGADPNDPNDERNYEHDVFEDMP